MKSEEFDNLFVSHPLTDNEIRKMTLIPSTTIYGNIIQSGTIVADKFNSLDYGKTVTYNRIGTQKPKWPNRLKDAGIFPTRHQALYPYRLNFVPSMQGMRLHTGPDYATVFDYLWGRWYEENFNTYSTTGKAIYEAAMKDYEQIESKINAQRPTENEWKRANAALTLPPSHELLMFPETGEIPFKSMEELQVEILKSACAIIETKRMKLNISGPMGFDYNDFHLRFMGMETFLLQRIIPVYREKEGKVDMLYYFKALDAGSTLRLYGITSTGAKKLFGVELNPIVEIIESESRSPYWDKIRQRLQFQLDSARYQNTGIEFGGW